LLPPSLLALQLTRLAFGSTCSWALGGQRPVSLPVPVSLAGSRFPPAFLLPAR